MHNNLHADGYAHYKIGTAEIEILKVYESQIEREKRALEID